MLKYVGFFRYVKNCSSFKAFYDFFMRKKIFSVNVVIFAKINIFKTGYVFLQKILKRNLFHSRSKTSAPSRRAIWKKKFFFPNWHNTVIFNIITRKKFWIVCYYIYNTLIKFGFDCRYTFSRKRFPYFVLNFDSLHICYHLILSPSSARLSLIFQKWNQYQISNFLQFLIKYK